jgi:hypothetical protein
LQELTLSDALARATPEWHEACTESGWVQFDQFGRLPNRSVDDRRCGMLELLARTGFLVKGLLYMVIGFLALQTAAGNGGRLTGTHGALVTVLVQPFGRVMLLVAAVGLLGYAVWRVLQGVLDPDRLGTHWQAKALRASYIGRGLLHALIGFQAIRLYRGLPSSGGGERQIAAEAFRWPLGDWLVVLAGLGLMAFGIQQIYAALACRLEPNLKVGNLRLDAGEWAVTVSRFGMGARAVVFIMFGWFVAVAGWSRDSSEVATTPVLMRILARQPGELGDWMLGIMAAGFIAYGFYQIVHARYLRIRPVASI